MEVIMKNLGSEKEKKAEAPAATSGAMKSEAIFSMMKQFLA